MSWSPEVFIGEFRPWPDSVHVVRGRTDEKVRYMPERTCHKDVQRTADGAPLMNGIFVCSECRFPWDSKNLYCGHCGAKVVE